MEVRAAARHIYASLTPASEAEVGVAYERLANHFPHLRRGQREHELAVEDWLDDLADMPADLVREACRMWRADDAHDRFPTPGELISLVKPIMAHRRLLRGRARDVIALVGDEQDHRPAAE